jgi:hypothetical protein
MCGLWVLLMLSLCEVSCAKAPGNVYPLDPSYTNLQSMTAEVQKLERANPGLVTLHILGTTAVGKNPVYALQIDSGSGKIPVLIVGQHHGDEVMGVEIALAVARSLTQADSQAQDLLDRYTFWIVPTLNPDGWGVVTSGKYEWRRKNNTDTNGNGKFDLKKDGVDLNRNYPVFWNQDPPRSPKDPNYKGKAPASEVEIQAIISLAGRVQFAYAFFYHSSVTGRFNEKLYLPWQDSRNKTARPYFTALRQLAHSYADAVPRDYLPGTYAVQAGNSSRVGNARNYFYQTWGTYALDIEVCGLTKYGKAIEHPGSELRAAIVQKNLKALLATLLAAE